MIETRCSICGKIIEVSAATVSAVQCQQCQRFYGGKADPSKASPATVKILTQCPGCKKQFRMYSASVGRETQCLNCGLKFIIAAVETPAQEPADSVEQPDTFEAEKNAFEKWRIRKIKEHTVVICSIILAIFMAAAVIDSVKFVAKSFRLAHPPKNFCILCNKKAVNTIVFGKIKECDSLYIQKDIYKNSPFKSLCWVCGIRLATTTQQYSTGYQIQIPMLSNSTGTGTMDICGHCTPPKSVKIKKFNSLSGYPVTIEKDINYSFCDNCPVPESLAAESIDLAKRRLICPAVAVLIISFITLLIVCNSLEIHGLGQYAEFWAGLWTRTLAKIKSLFE